MGCDLQEAAAAAGKNFTEVAAAWQANHLRYLQVAVPLLPILMHLLQVGQVPGGQGRQARHAHHSLLQGAGETAGLWIAVPLLWHAGLWTAGLAWKLGRVHRRLHYLHEAAPHAALAAVHARRGAAHVSQRRMVLPSALAILQLEQIATSATADQGLGYVNSREALNISLG